MLLNNKKGFIMVMVFLIPLFVICLSTTLALIFCIRNYDYTQSVCMQQALKTQKQLAIRLKKLLRLNPQVKNLRRQYIETEAKLVAALASSIFTFDAATVASLKAKLKALKVQMQNITLKQTRILGKSQLDVTKHFKQFKTKVFKKYKAMVFNHDNFVHHRPFPLAVIKKSAKGVVAFSGSPPTYLLKFKFSQKQKISFFYRFYLHQDLPRWIRKQFFLNKLSHYHCSATLYKGGFGLWQARLIK